MTQDRSWEEDEELVARIRGGDSAAEVELSTKYQDRILYFARRKLPSVPDAEDIRQETMLAVIRAARDGRIERARSLSSYIYRTCRNKISNFHSRGMNPARTVSIDDVKESAISVLPKDKDWPGSKLRQILKTRWGKLKFLDRRILYLKYMRGMKYEDMAPILGLSPQTLKKRAQRAKEKMRHGLK